MVLSKLFRGILLTFLVALCSMQGDAQVAVKTNLLYDATTTPNLGM